MAMASPTASLFTRDDSLIVVLPGAEAGNPASLRINLIMRVVLGLTANLACVVPLKQLYRGGEFSAVVFIGNMMFVNAKNMANALLWPTDDTDTWWPGYGLCDVNPYVHNVTVSLYVTCLLAIMRNLAQQVGLLRANPLSGRERRRRNLVQALIMFPLPLIQMAWVWPLTSQRFVVATLVGCAWSGWPSWPYIFFFGAAPVFISVITAGYAVLVFIRFRQVAHTTRTALSTNRAAHLRAQRAKRRLYLMVLSILVPFLPIVITLAVLNVRQASPLLPFDYALIHDHVFPFPWDTIVYLPSAAQDFGFLNNAYIAIVSAIPVFVFFGMTKAAMNDYRRALLWCGLGRLFPVLHQEYDPDREAYGNSSTVSSRTTNTTTTTNTSSTSSTTKKIYSFLSKRQANPLSTSPGDTSQVDTEQGHHPPTARSSPASTYNLNHHQTTTHDSQTQPQLPERNPFLYRTHINFSIPLGPLLPSLFKKKPTTTPPPDLPLTSVSPLHPTTTAAAAAWDVPALPPRVQTRVWSDDDDGDEDPIIRRATPVDSLRTSPGGGRAGRVTVETEVTRQSHGR